MSVEGEGGVKKYSPQHERVLRPLHLVAGRVKRLFLVYFKPAVFKSDRKQVSSSIHSLWVSLGCCKQHEIFVWEHHHGSSILAMAMGHKGFPMCSTRWEGVSFAGARGPVKQELCCVLTVAMFESCSHCQEQWEVLGFGARKGWDIILERSFVIERLSSISSVVWCAVIWELYFLWAKQTA